WFWVTYAGAPIAPIPHGCTQRYFPVRFTICADASVTRNAANVPITQDRIFIGSPPPVHGKRPHRNVGHQCDKVTLGGKLLFPIGRWSNAHAHIRIAGGLFRYHARKRTLKGVSRMSA